jgi:hypothetical protein
VGEDKDYPGSKIYNIKALSVTTTRNNRKYNENEMMLGGRSLSFRPMNRNHQPEKTLPYPANQTLIMDYDKDRMAVTGKMRIADAGVQALIDSGKINKLSIEQIPYKGESCSTQSGICEQNGVIFTGLALLDWDTMPGDASTSITKAESLVEIPLYEIVECEFGCAMSESSELARSNIADVDFGYVSKDGKTRKLPIHDAAHARNALARFNQTDLPASAKAAVYQKIVKRAKKFSVQVSDEQANYASRGFAGYDDLDDCTSQNADQDDPYGYCTKIMTKSAAITGMGMQIPTPGKKEHDMGQCDVCKTINEGFFNFVKAEQAKREQGVTTSTARSVAGDRKTKLTIDDIKNYWNSLNDSQRAHVVDPNDRYPNTNKFSKKPWDELSQDQQTAMIKTFGFRHSWDDVKKLLPPDAQDPDTGIVLTTTSWRRTRLRK